MALNLKQISQIYRPQGVKTVSLGNAVTKGGQINIGTGSVDLSVPITGFRFVFKGRLAIGTANYTSITPNGLLNVLKSIKISGVNARQGGNVTVFSMDLASWFDIGHMFNRRFGHHLLSQAGAALTLVGTPSTPYPTGLPVTFQKTDFIITFDIPFGPLDIGGSFVPGFAARRDQWGDSLQIQVTVDTLTDNATNALGVSAATSTTALTSYGADTGNATLDVYSLPAIMGVDLAPSVIPGVLSRVTQPITSQVQNGGNNVNLLTLQKQNTGRLFLRTGISTDNPSMSSLSDVVVTSLGVVVGANRDVRALSDIFAHKLEWSKHYKTDPIIGMVGFDFLQSGSPFSAYPGLNVGDGATFQMVANITGTANALSLAVQEQHLFDPAGPLYS